MILLRRREDLADLPPESDLEAYAAMPVDQFGMALLRCGWWCVGGGGGGGGGPPPPPPPPPPPAAIPALRAFFVRAGVVAK